MLNINKVLQILILDWQNEDNGIDTLLRIEWAFKKLLNILLIEH